VLACNSDGVAPPAFVHQILSDVRATIDAVERIETLAVSVGAPVGERLRVAAVSCAAHSFPPEVLRTFHQLYSETKSAVFVGSHLNMGELGVAKGSRYRGDGGRTVRAGC
jgi:DNA-binding transcriptional LysR family regulator